MDDTILGLHHVTAIAGPALRNLFFYREVLGQRLLKKTVNFDDPTTYHFYFGNETGSPGTILTFFPWGDIVPGRRGSHMATEIGYAVPAESFDFWLRRFDQYNVIYNKPSQKFGEPYLTFLDPDGLKLELVVAKTNDSRTPRLTTEINANVAIRGFHYVTLTLNKIGPTAAILTEVFGYQLVEQHINRYRFRTYAVANAALVDLVELPTENRGHVAGGTIHHVAFRVKDEKTLMQYREKIASRGLDITDKVDRNYFYSLYFREPGGVLFEIATDIPGFAIDEPLAELGTHLRLPPQLETKRAEIESKLPKLI